MKKLAQKMIAMAMLAWQFAAHAVAPDCYVSFTQGSSNPSAAALAFYSITKNPDTGVETVRLRAELNHTVYGTFDVHIRLYEDNGDTTGLHCVADQWWSNTTASGTAFMTKDYLRCGTTPSEAKFLIEVYAPGTQSTPLSYNWVRIRKS